MSGLALLGAATALFATARSLVILELARVLQGLASSVPATIGVALLLDKVGTQHIGEALGWTSLALTLGFFLGPILGGFLYQYLGYHATFAPAYILVVLEIGLRALIIEEQESASNDAPLLVDRGAYLEHRAYGTIEGLPHRKSIVEEYLHNGYEQDEELSKPSVCYAHESAVVWSDDDSIVSNDASTAVAHGNPIFVLLTDPRMQICMLALVIVNSFNGVLESILPLYCHEIFGFVPSQVALVFVPSSIPLLLSPWIGKFVDRAGSRRPAIIAFGLGMITFIIMGHVVANTTVDLAVMAVALLCFGLFVSIAVPAMMVEIAATINDLHKHMPEAFGSSGAFSLGFGLNHSLFSFGVLLGSTYGGVIRSLLGWTTLMYTSAALCSLPLGFIICYL